MRNVGTLARRELGSLFLSPIAWVVTTVFLVLLGAVFVKYLDMGALAGMATLAPTFYILPFILAFTVPLLTMRQVAEERRSGTIELLATAPVTDVELVLGKFLGSAVFFLFILLPTAVYAWVLFHYSDTGPDKWMLASGYLGTLLMGMFMLSFGLFVSCVTREQIVAGVVGAISLFLLWILGFFLPMTPPASLTPSVGSMIQEAAYRVGGFVSFSRHLEPFTRGIVDTADVVFFLSFTAFFLFLAVAAVSTRKWR